MNVQLRALLPSTHEFNFWLEGRPKAEARSALQVSAGRASPPSRRLCDGDALLLPTAPLEAQSQGHGFSEFRKK